MFQNPFSFEGCIRRTEYGISKIIYTIIIIAITQLSDSAGFICIALIPLLWFIIAQGTKRCHDRNNSGWYQLIPFYEFWMLFADSDEGVNEYGGSPKEIVDAYEIEKA
jgi:uncharacterized membrane protein YhaH (DUF805 family)